MRSLGGITAVLVVVACQPVREVEEKKEEESVKAVVVDAVVGDTLEMPVTGCDAELSDVPVALFGDAMLARCRAGSR